MEHIILNNTDEYLIRQRGRNNRDIARVLRKFNRYFFTRDQIPLDEVIYPDYLLDDLRQINRIAHRIIAQLDDAPIDGLQIRQLELTFEKKE